MADPKAQKNAVDNANKEPPKPIEITQEYYNPELGTTFAEKFNWSLSKDWKYDESWGSHSPSRYTLTCSEQLNISDWKWFVQTKPFSEHIDLADAVKSSFSKPFFVNLTINDKRNTRFKSYRRFNTSLKISDHISYDAVKQLCDQFVIFDTILRPANAVLSDIIAEQGSWAEEELSRYIFKGKPAGYTFFKPFVFGEYRYKSALFRTSLDATRDDSLYIENFSYSVDVPDIVDRGSGELVDKNFDLEVKFNKHFHTAPEVTVSMKSGESSNTVIPAILEITKNGFKLNLRKASDDSLTTGRFIWTAVGY